jgi:hypothetical protein
MRWSCVCAHARCRAYLEKCGLNGRQFGDVVFKEGAANALGGGRGARLRLWQWWIQRVRVMFGTKTGHMRAQEYTPSHAKHTLGMLVWAADNAT